MHRACGLFHEIGESIAVGPDHIFEIELESSEAILLAFTHHRLDESPAPGSIGKQLMKPLLTETRFCRGSAVVYDNRHDRYVVLFRRLHHQLVGTAPQQALAIHGIPSGHEDINLLRMIDK